MPKTMPGPPLTADELRRTFSYDEATGLFTRTSHWQTNLIGRVAGTIDKRGRNCIVIRTRTYYAHRLVWLYVHGRWPVAEIDHINRDCSDNRLVNLREATRFENMANRVPATPPLSGVVGVREQRTTYAARTSVRGKRLYLGAFATQEEAEAAYIAVKGAAYGEYARFND